MPEGSLAAQAAQCEDWDSDESSAIPGTLVQAQQSSRRHQQQPASSSSNTRHPRPPDAASDSGYSSLAAKSPPALSAPIHASAQPVAPQQVLRSPTKPKSKPVIHRADSVRTAQPAQPRPKSTAPPAAIPVSSERQKRKCSDPNCRDPTCGSAQSADQQRYSQFQQQQVPSRNQYPAASQYQQPPTYQYAQMSPAQTAAMMPPPPVPRPRTASVSRQPRPVSIHGYSSMSYNGAPGGPPPAASAYYAYSQPYPQSQQSYLDTRAPQMVSYPPTSPVPQSPTSPSVTYPGYPGYSGSFSARQANPAVPGLEMPRQMPASGLSRTMSARQRGDERPRKPSQSYYTDSESESASESDYTSDEDYIRQRQDPRRKPYGRESALAVVHHSGRPSMSRKYATETTVPTRSRRESMPRDALRRAPQSDTYVEYQSSSDVGDSDRTARAVVDRRSTFSSARSSRRPSVSTTASSGRTKATTLSSMTDASRGQLVVEGKNGRRAAYLSKEEQAVRRYQQQQLEEKIAAYQTDMSGGDPYELTAENIRKATNRKSGSHVSGRSQKSAGSGTKTSRSEGIQIKSGDTVLHVYGDAKIEMRPGEVGGPAQFVIASSSGRESEYRGSSKSSGSRVGRSRGRSELSRRAIREDPNDYQDGYEVAR